MSEPSTSRITLMAAGAALGGFLFGFDTSTMNAAIVGVRETLRLSSGLVGFIAAIALIGCAVGAWFAGPIAEKRSRNRVMLIAGVLVTAGSLGAALIDNAYLLAAFRFMSGLGIGAASAVVPGYIAEISPTEIRGRLGSFWQFAIVTGQLIGLLVGLLLTRAAGGESHPLAWEFPAWRWMFVATGIPAAMYILLVLKLPRTMQDRRRGTSAAEGRALARLRGPRFGLQGIVWTGVFLAAFQQLAGISVVKTYSNTVWQAVGFSTTSSFTISMVTVGISIASTLVAIAIMDRIGRRTLLMSGAAVMAIALAVLALCFASATGSGESLSLGHDAGIGALVAINVFAIAFGISWGPVVWLMLNELFSTDIRTTAVAVCTTVNWLTNWAVVRTFPLIAGVGLEFAYGLFAAMAVLAFLFAWRVLPETRERDLG